MRNFYYIAATDIWQWPIRPTRSASHAVIEQAKGALMLDYGLDADAAIALLSWQPQSQNIKLRDLPQRLAAAPPGDATVPTSLRQRLDEVVYGLVFSPAGEHA